jgi:hypothetical protein
MRITAALGVAAGVAVGASRVPALLAEVEAFRVEGVRLEGARFLAPEEALRTLAIPSGASVWDDPAPWIEPLLLHPLVAGVDVGRHLPDTLVLRVTETEPVALVPTPTLEPVDADGQTLPIDPSRHRLDLPLLRVGEAMGDGTAPTRVRGLARELDRLGKVDPSFVGMLSELAAEGPLDVVALWGDPGVAIHFRPPLAVDRLREAMAVLEDATLRYPDRRPRAVDLRYAEQVVVRF